MVSPESDDLQRAVLLRVDRESSEEVKVRYILSSRQRYIVGVLFFYILNGTPVGTCATSSRGDDGGIRSIILAMRHGGIVPTTTCCANTVHHTGAAARSMIIPAHFRRSTAFS